MPWEDFRKPSIERCMGTKIGMVEIFLKITETLTKLMVSRWNSSGIFSQDSIRCSSVKKSNVYCSDYKKHQKISTGRIIFMSMFNDISCGSKDNATECLANAKLVSLYSRRFGKGQWSVIGPGSEKNWYSISEDSLQGIWDKIAEKMMLEFGESGHPVFRATTPLSRGQLKSKGHGNCRYTMQPIWKRLRLFFA